eukprot:TRINITY_DN596_c0_g1_i1.p1 TRINITY_DN596_c0_g1~~TRINITY_DN596_c0_g1_i1.p1  ORF type:complete len:393 (+),score=77.38 TRINITY_DN596_c0_g1_i1:31-1179(+)
MDSAAEATESTALLPGSDGVPSVPLSRWERFKRIRGSPAASLAVATLALFTDAFCYGAVVPYQPTYERLYNLSDASLGLVMGSYAFVMTPFTPIAGILSDRFGRTIPFTGGVVALAAATFLFAFAPNLILLVLARCMQGLAGACTWASALAIVDDNYKGESHGTATGFAMMGFAVGMMSSPPIAGVMLQYVGYITPFMFAVGLCVVDTLLRLICMVGKPSDTGAEDLLIEAAPDPTSINAPTPPATPTKSKPGSAATTAKKTVRQQLSALFTSPVVVPLLILNFISAFSVSCMEVIYPLHMAHAMDASPGQIGGVFGAVNVSFGLFSWIGGIICDRVGRAPVLVLSLIGLAGTMMGISFPTNIWMAAGIGVRVFPHLLLFLF